MESCVTIITPTIGHRFLRRCIESVQGQTLTNVEHYIVIDGPQYKEKVLQIIREVTLSLGDKLNKTIHTLVLPYNVGSNGWNGHRVYGSVPYLCNSSHVAFLDEDNWYNKQHLELLFGQLQKDNARWGFSLRNIYTEELSLIHI